MTDAFVGALYYVERHRNAWFGRHSQNWFQWAAFHPTREVARRQVERLRERGARWEIIEAPALIVVGTRHLFAVLQLDTDEPLTHFRLEFADLPTLRSVAGQFPGTEQILRYRGPVMDIRRFRAPGSWWSSTSYGAPPIELSWYEGDRGGRPWLQGVSRKAYRRLARQLRKLTGRE